MADSEKPSVTADPLACGDDDKFELAIFLQPRNPISKKVLVTSTSVFRNSLRGTIGKLNVEQIQQQRYDKQFFKVMPKQG